MQFIARTDTDRGDAFIQPQFISWRWNDNRDELDSK